MRKILYSIACLFSLVIIGLILFSYNHASSDGQVSVVAAENFWGSLVGQIGGDKVKVLSIISDPNANPHQYESSSVDARAIYNASYVVVNGSGYDYWATSIINASPSKHRRVLDVASYLHRPTGSNPHLWYNPSYINKVIVKMTNDLSSISPKNAPYFRNNLNRLEVKLSANEALMAAIKKQYGGEKVAATEDIFVYLAKYLGLDLISPPEFMQAVAEGTDPSARSVITFQNQLKQRQPKILVFNKQTITPLTSAMKSIANQYSIPVVGITETIQPPKESYEAWMNNELKSIQNALQRSH